MGRREENKRKVERRILEAGLRLLSEEGAASVTVQDIADEAGVSRATFFNYFESKQGIAAAFGDRQCGIAEECARTLDESMPTCEKIRAVMRVDHDMVKEHLRNEVFARYVLNTMMGSESMARLEMVHWEELAGVYARLVEAGKGNGDVPPDVDAVLAGRMIVEAYFAFQMEYLFGESDTGEFMEKMDRRLEVLFRGFGLGEAQPHSSPKI